MRLCLQFWETVDKSIIWSARCPLSAVTYRFRVNATLEWPIITDRLLGSAPRSTILVAKLCRKIWGVTWRIRAIFAVLLHILRRWDLSIGSPWTAKMKGDNSAPSLCDKYNRELFQRTVLEIHLTRKGEILLKLQNGMFVGEGDAP